VEIYLRARVYHHVLMLKREWNFNFI